MLTEEQPTLRYLSPRYLSPRTYLRKTNYGDLPFADSWEIFVAERAALLADRGIGQRSERGRESTIGKQLTAVYHQARWFN